MYPRENHYSIAIYPPSPTMDIIEGMKKKLAAVIGWFNSKNSKGHITICNFNADDKEISLIKSKLTAHCNSESGLNLHFDHLGNYPNGTFCLLPNVSSHNSLNKMMKRVQKIISARGLYKSTNPHITIGRNLDEDKSVIAGELFTKVGMNFYCDRIVLRVLNPEIKQYEVVDEFIFQDKPNPSNEQLTLF